MTFHEGKKVRLKHFSSGALQNNSNQGNRNRSWDERKDANKIVKYVDSNRGEQAKKKEKEFEEGCSI